MPIHISHIDHLVLTVRDIAVTCQFYAELAMKGISFADTRKVLVFDNHKFNLQEVGKEYEPKAQNPASGTIDLV